MKRILFFLLLLVNLQLTTDNGSLSIEFGEVSAQRVMESQLGKTVTRGGNGEDRCRWYGNGCRMEFNNDYAREIHEWGCPYRSVDCPSCGKQYIPAYGHFCEQNCPFCNMTLNMCVCDDLVITGRWTWISSDPDYIPDYLNNRDDDGNWGGDGNNNEEDEPLSLLDSILLNPTKPYPRSIYSMKELKAMSGFKLVKNLPNHLHIQPKGNHDCCPRAIAFMLEHKNPIGFNYDEVLGELKNIAKKWGYPLKESGVPYVPSDRILQMYGEYITSDALNENDIIRKINAGIPVAIGVTKQCPHFPDQHMVTVIGYDRDFFYVAAGNIEGSANVIPRVDVQDPNKRNWFTRDMYYVK